MLLSLISSIKLLLAQATDSTAVNVTTDEGNWIWPDLKRAGLVLLVIAVFYFGIRFLNWVLSWLIRKLTAAIQRWLTSNLDARNSRKLNPQQIAKLLGNVLGIAKVLMIILMFFIALPVLFSIFPATEPITNRILELVLDPVKQFGRLFVDYIPSMITIVVILIIARYFVRLLAYFAKEIRTGQLNIKGFYPDWAQPTLNLLRVIIFIFAFILIFPYLPGSDSPAFQGVGVFLGLLLSLGSTSAVGNIIAGLVIIYMRAFTIGDRVRIGDTMGDVIEKTMLVTRIRTIKNEDVTIPNSAILTGSTTNYSSSAEELGLILNTTITIGYDVDWRQVHQLLVDAANNTDGVEREPEPFVLQTSLDDFFVSYQINAYTKDPKGSAAIYSELHAHIQDAFNHAGIEILSPHYRAERNGNDPAMPKFDSRTEPDIPPFTN